MSKRKLIFKFEGGPKDGKTVIGQPGEQDEADRYYALTDHGRVGQRFRTASPYAIDTLTEEQLREERPHHFRPHVYEVAEHVGDEEQILVRAEYVPKQAR